MPFCDVYKEEVLAIYDGVQHVCRNCKAPIDIDNDERY